MKSLVLVLKSSITCNSSGTTRFGCQFGELTSHGGRSNAIATPWQRHVTCQSRALVY